VWVEALKLKERSLMPDCACNDRSASLPVTSVFRFASLSEVSRLLGTVADRFRGRGRSKPAFDLSLAVLALGAITPTAGPQGVVNYPSGFTEVTGHTTPDDPLVGGPIHLLLSQRGWSS
jgi:hypothetical protein